jgi:hypothetical protein
VFIYIQLIGSLRAFLHRNGDENISSYEFSFIVGWRNVVGPVGEIRALQRTIRKERMNSIVRMKVKLVCFSRVGVKTSKM